MINEQKSHGQAWASVVAITMIIAGCACFILSVVAAMIVANKNK